MRLHGTNIYSVLLISLFICLFAGMKTFFNAAGIKVYQVSVNIEASSVYILQTWDVPEQPAVGHHRDQWNVGYLIIIPKLAIDVGHPG